LHLRTTTYHTNWYL